MSRTKPFKIIQIHYSTVLTSLKSPIRGIWFFLCLPSTAPVFDITTEINRSIYKNNTTKSQFRVSKIFVLLQNLTNFVFQQQKFAKDIQKLSNK